MNGLARVVAVSGREVLEQRLPQPHIMRRFRFRVVLPLPARPRVVVISRRTTTVGHTSDGGTSMGVSRYSPSVLTGGSNASSGTAFIASNSARFIMRARLRCENRSRSTRR
jgi:hypothetical protein